MTDLTDAILPLLKSTHPNDFPLDEGMVFPMYAGRSVLNIPGSLCRWLDVPGFGAQPLQAKDFASLQNNYRRVVLVLMDAMSLERFLKWLEGGLAPVWQQLLQDGVLLPLTSTVPSTTSTALTSIWTGCSPIEHGTVGYELWLKEYGVVANMITHAPISFRGDVGSLSKAGFEPEKAFPFPTLGTHLLQHGVQTYTFLHHSIVHSGLSRMLFRDSHSQGFSTASELWINLRALMDGKPRERQFLWVYWGEVDHYSHLHGPEDERPGAEFQTFSYAFERFFLNKLKARHDTLLILVADHGQIFTPLNPIYDLKNHPNLIKNLHILPTGESRLMYLFIRPGHTEAVKEYFQQVWPEDFYLIKPREMVKTGAMGSGKAHPRLYDRIGDLIAAARGCAYLWWADKENNLLGRHGGFTEQEMLVPFLAVKI
jgi:predicted AlkP superfamily pyrophosphatase or phosphodiesterase